MTREGPQEWLDWVEANWVRLGHERLRVGLSRMVVYAGKKGLYYLDGDTKRPFSEKIVSLVLRMVKKELTE